DTYFFQGNTHLPLEQHACVAEWQPSGKLTMWTSTQSPHYVHKELAKALALREDQVRVIAPPVGGGFGGKLELFQHEAAAAKLAMLTGRPIKAALNREEVFYCHRGRHPVLMHVKTGWTQDGCMTAMDLTSLFDGGAYTSYGGAGQPLYWNDMPHSSVDIRLDRSGLVTVSCGQIDIGQGSNSMLVTVVAEALGARPEQITLISADTDLTPIDLGSYSSRVTFMAGNAAISAATQLRNLLVNAAADELDVPLDELVLRRGTLWRRDGQGPKLGFAELVKRA